MTQTEAWTVARLLKWTEDYLAQQGSDSARLDAEVLLAHAAGGTRIELYARFQEVVDETVRGAFRGLVKQRAAGAPVSYLVGAKEFYSLRFEVTPDVLIPRPETETLVLEAIELAKRCSPPRRAADIGVGSGVIAICLAKYADCKVVGVEVSPAALEVAQANAAAHQVADEIELRQGSLLEPLDASEQFELIVSNPPYVSQSEYEQLSPTVREYEPKQALLAGPNGDEVFRQLAGAATEHLAADGWLLVELSPMIIHQCAAYANELGYRDVEVINDLSGRARVLKAKK